MLERLNPALRVLCLILAGTAVLQLGLMAGRTRLQSNLRPSESLLTSAIMEPPIAQTTQTTETAVASPTNRPGPAVANRMSAPRGPGGPAANVNADLPSDVQARIERITQSEILGAIIRPLPMALLGIAGPDVILRAPDGRTGLIRIGEELGGVKLLQIGTNRVLVEHENQRKELMLFSGFGGESLLPNEKKERP